MSMWGIEKHILLVSSVAAALMATAGCGKGVQFSIGQTSQAFTQNGGSVNGAIDVLWVVDNSASMAPIQANLTNNFSSFISNFQNQNYDFHMAVTATDAYKANPNFSQYSASNNSLSLYQDGQPGSTSGVFVILPSTPNLDTVFVDNASTGIDGSGDERAFSSMMTALNNTANPAFLRPSSFFAIIILSDEDDLSNYNRAEGSWGNSNNLDHCYYDSTMDSASSMGDPTYVTQYAGNTHASDCQGISPQTPPDSINSYVTALDTLTQSTGATRRWNVSTITVLDPICQASHFAQTSVAVVGQRYMQLSQATDGIQGSICDASFANSLSNISNQIATLTTQFFLNRIPQLPTLSVVVNGVTIPQDPNNGWTYSSANNAIQFHGTSIPPKGASVTVNFTPVSLAT